MQKGDTINYKGNEVYRNAGVTKSKKVQKSGVITQIIFTPANSNVPVDVTYYAVKNKTNPSDVELITESDIIKAGGKKSRRRGYRRNKRTVRR
jgi:hypothetical protein